MRTPVRATRAAERDAESSTPSARRSAATARGPNGGLLALQRERGNRAVRRLLGDAERTARAGAGGSPAGRTPGLVDATLGSAGRPLDPGTRAFMETRFGRDFGRVRVHDDDVAARSARALDATAYAAGRDVVFAGGQYRPETRAGAALLAHELAHVVQQAGRTGVGALDVATANGRREREAEGMARDAMAGRSHRRVPSRPPTVARSVDDPERFERVHRHLFVEAPGAGTQAPRPWTDGTAAALVRQVDEVVRQRVARNPMSVLGSVSVRTMEASAEADARAVDELLRARFPMIPTRLSNDDIERAVTVFTADRGVSEEFLRQWLTNRLIQWTDVEAYGVTEDDPRFQELLTTLVSDRSTFDFGPC